MKHKTIYAILLLSMYIFTFAFANIFPVTSTTSKATDELADIQSAGVLKVGADTTYPPFESINETTQKAEGFDVDLANYIAGKMGVTAQIITSAWDPIIPNLQNGQFNIILSAMTITPERAQQVNFTRWYYQSYQAVLVPKDNPLNITSVQQLNKTGINIGMESGTTEFLYADANLTAATIHPYNDFATAVTAMDAGQIDVVLADIAVAALDAVNGQHKIVATYQPEYFGIAVKIGENNLLNKLNDILNGLLGTNLTSPTFSADYNAMYEKWFLQNAPGYTSQATPGFEYYGIFLLALIPIIRKIKKQKL